LSHPLSILAASVVGFLACGLSDSGNGPNSAALRSRVEFVADEALRTAVKVDSVSWAPSFFPVEFGGRQEIIGLYAIQFRNVTNSRLEIRYELRFLDRDDFTIDVFNPFGQPLRLGPGGVEEVSGEFRIRIRQSEDAELLRTLLVVIHISRSA
jgi:hypothetical protein